MNTRKFIYALLFLLATSAFSQQVKAQTLQWSYLDVGGARYGVGCNLYIFQLSGPYHIGTRIGFPTCSLDLITQHPFAWDLQGNILTIRYSQSLTIDVFRLDVYNAVLDIQSRTGVNADAAAWGPGPWYGCRNGAMPAVIRSYVCPSSPR